jgi:outer membrane protein
MRFSKGFSISLLALTLATSLPLVAAEKGSSIGVVDFAKCVKDSKAGKAEQNNFDSVKNRMHKAIEDLDVQLNETASKLQDKDLLDSLSPEAEGELKMRFQSLNEDMQRYQGQYYQVMQQANMKLIQTMAEMINRDSEAVAKKNKFQLVLNKEAAFHFTSNLDVTDQVIGELDKLFDKGSEAVQASSKLPTTEGLKAGE